MKRLLALVVVLVLTGCSGPLAPTAVTPALRSMAYAINIPDTGAVQSLNARYPEGVSLAPLEAQRQWDYTLAYGGTPNVYWGPVAPPCQNYFNTSVVIAPAGVAGVRTFTALDWPGAHLDAGVTYEWRGYFTVSYPSAPGSTMPCR